jgi:flagellar assembly protein FliH
MGIRKFQFDDFDIDENPQIVFDEMGVAVEQAPPTFTLEELETARQEAERTGRELAAQEAAISLNADIAAALRDLADQTAILIEERRRQGEFIATEAVRLSTLIARKVLPAMAEANALREIEALILSCFRDRPEESRLVIRLPDHLLDSLGAKLESLMRDTGFAGKPILLADPTLKRAEARIEWANGGAEWSFEAQLAELESAAGKITKPHRKTIHAKVGDEHRGDEPEQESTP